MSTSATSSLNLDNLLERILTARPNAGVEDVRQLAPVFRDILEKDLIDRMGRVRQRITAKSRRKAKR